VKRVEHRAFVARSCQQELPRDERVIGVKPSHPDQERSRARAASETGRLQIQEHVRLCPCAGRNQAGPSRSTPDVLGKISDPIPAMPLNRSNTSLHDQASAAIRFVPRASERPIDRVG
jgi:hypothetical protein